jgi:undecaprenyl-diphosphatase
MSSDPTPNQAAADAAAAEQRVEGALERGLAEIKTPAAADKALDDLERLAPAMPEDASTNETPVTAREQAAAVADAAATPAKSRAAAVIAETAVQVSAASPQNRPVLDAAIAGATGPTDATAAHGEMPPPQKVLRARRLLRRALIRRLRPLDAIDSIVFLGINHLPHPRRFDRLMSRFSWAMTGGVGWGVVILIDLLINRRRGWETARGVVPALWLATATVEYPIKYFFRRRRPFLSIVRAIIVGRKPASYSFPSGHSAAAFAGATLLARHYPRAAKVFFFVAALVGFSRIYLGAHYPGDVVTGAVGGAMLARIYRAILRMLGRLIG